MTKTLFIRHEERTSDILDLIHTDVCGLILTQAKGGYFYFITFIDDKSGFGYMYLIKYKFEVFDKFKEYQNMVEK